MWDLLYGLGIGIFDTVLYERGNTQPNPADRLDQETLTGLQLFWTGLLRAGS